MGWGGGAGGSQDSPGALGWGENRIQGTHSPRQAGGSQSSRQAGAGRPLEKRWPRGTPWVKVKPWKMGTPPNSGEDEIIPAEPIKALPRAGKEGFYWARSCRDVGQLPRKEARPALGPRPSARGPTLARKRDEGRAGAAPKPEGWGWLVSGGASSWKNRLGPGQRSPRSSAKG